MLYSSTSSKRHHTAETTNNQRHHYHHITSDRGNGEQNNRTQSVSNDDDDEGIHVHDSGIFVSLNPLAEHDEDILDPVRDREHLFGYNKVPKKIPNSVSQELLVRLQIQDLSTGAHRLKMIVIGMCALLAIATVFISVLSVLYISIVVNTGNDHWLWVAWLALVIVLAVGVIRISHTWRRYRACKHRLSALQHSDIVELNDDELGLLQYSTKRISGSQDVTPSSVLSFDVKNVAGRFHERV